MGLKKKKEEVYVTYTCKKCGKAFVDLDPMDSINEIPLKTRYCPDCVAKGYVNSNKAVTPEQQRSKEIKAMLNKLSEIPKLSINPKSFDELE